MQFDYSQKSFPKPKILIYLFGSLGDTLVAIPALRAVRRHFSDAELILLQNTAASANVVQASQVIPENLIDGYFSYSGFDGKDGALKNFYKLWNQIRADRFQAAIYLVISERPAKSVFRDRLFFRTAGIKKLYGFHSFSKTELYPVDVANVPAITENESIRKLNRLKKDGIGSIPEDFQTSFIPFSAAEIEKIKKWLEFQDRRGGVRLVSIAPGCKTVANNWSLENFIEIGHRLLAEENCELVVVGGKAEKEIGREMISKWGSGVNSAGELSVRESAALLSLCDFHFGLDTGTTHLAAVVGTPCFALYGERNNPGQWFPIGGGHTIIQHQVECAGCRLHACPFPAHPCMKEISTDAVWSNLMEFINNKNIERDAPTKVIYV